jgi:tetratricopeptide (TPR) repeat protein
LALLLLFGCKFGSHRDAGKRGNPDEALARLDASDAAAAKDPSLHARAGWLRYLIASDPRGAALHLTPASQQGPAALRALALCGLGELADDLTDPVQAARHYATALATAPQEPIAELAALRLLDLEGESPAVDDLVVGAAASLTTPMAPRAARLVREANARIQTRRAQAARDPKLEVDAWQKIGTVQRWRVAGPFMALRLFDLTKPAPLDTPERKTVSANARNLEVPDGDLGLDLEPADGDLFYSGSEVTLARGGNYILWVEGAAALEARIDGDVLISRVPYPQEVPRSRSVAVTLAPGKHEVLVRWSRSEGSRFRITLARGDGAASDATSAFPETLSGFRKPGSCALGKSCTASPAWTDSADLRTFSANELQQDPGDPLAAYLWARAVIGDDRIAARAAVDAAVQFSSSGAPALALRAYQLLHDSDVPDRIGRGRGLSDLSEAARKDGQMVRARLGAAALLRESERYDDAAAGLDKAEASLREAGLAPTARLLMARARLFDTRGNPAGAKTRALEALKVAPGRCDTLQLLYELSRRESAAAEQRKWAEQLLQCEGGIAPLAGLLKDRSELPAAEALQTLAVRLRPAQPQRLEQLSETQAARKEYPQAIASLETAAQLSPRSPEPWRRVSALQELSGDARGAGESRAAALRLAPGDLALRQQIALDRGERLMPWSDRDGLAIAKSAHTQAQAGASAVLLLDHGAAEFYPDGGAVERVHTVARVLDKKGVARFGEAQVPSDAQILHLRTIKRDGRILEPESIPEKEGVSLPGLEPGDSVEVDYLRGIPPRGPDLPGQALSGFFFKDDETAMQESTYDVRAPWPLEADAHHMTLPPGALQGGRFQYTARDVAAATPEPHAPGELELFPWVQLGTGAGQKDLARSTADWALLRTRPTSSTLELARKNVGVSVSESLKLIYAAVALSVRGRSQGTDFSQPAPHILAQGRGNRLVLLKSALAAAQIPSHIVLTRTITTDPAPYRFARGELFAYAVLRVDVGGDQVWIDPSYRLAPLGQLPTFVRGMDAWVLPEPGEEPQEIKLPTQLPDQQDGRKLSMELHLDANGDATGSLRDEYYGFEAASLKDVLERMDKDQRKQSVEAMLGRGLHGMTLESLQTEHESELGGSAALVSTLRSQFARKDGNRLYVPQSPIAARLVRRLAQIGERTQPLLIDTPELIATHVEIILPKGMHLKPGFAPSHLDTPFGAYDFNAREEDGKLIMDDNLRVPAQRVQPDRYAEFVRFARAVDDAQQSELIVEGPPAAPVSEKSK